MRTGMPIRIDNPRELGADRLVNAIAAYDRIGGACIVVDFGTAITYDVVSADGALLGALISPGAEIAVEALTERAARAAQGRARRAAARVIGKSTVDAIRAGVVYGYAGQVDGIVAPPARRARGRTRRRSPPAASPTLIVPHTDTIDQVDDLLTLNGLRLIHERNDDA